MSKERQSISTIINAWKEVYGEKRVSENDFPYIVMSGRNIMENLKILAKSMLDQGYTFDEIDDYHVGIKIADICWREEKIYRMSDKEIKRAKRGLINDWEEAIAPYSGVILSKIEKEEEKSLTEEEMQKLANAADKVRSHPINGEKDVLDLDFLKLMGAPIPDSENDE